MLVIASMVYTAVVRGTEMRGGKVEDETDDYLLSHVLVAAALSAFLAACRLAAEYVAAEKTQSGIHGFFSCGRTSTPGCLKRECIVGFG